MCFNILSKDLTLLQSRAHTNDPAIPVIATAITSASVDMGLRNMLVQTDAYNVSTI